jgi:hypothetical protein
MKMAVNHVPALRHVGVKLTNGGRLVLRQIRDEMKGENLLTGVTVRLKFIDRCYCEVKIY